MPAEILLDVRNLCKTFAGRGRAASKTAVRGVSFTIQRGATFALIGPSGSGKSTIARCLAGFETPDSGEIRFAGRPLGMQLIPQQPAASLNPRFTARAIIEEPLVIQRRPRGDRAVEAMRMVGLEPSMLARRALQFSGGERQRLAIARALVLEPELLILDESFAGLDPDLQEQIAILLRSLQRRLGTAYLLISHDLELVGDLASEIAVMQDGAILEHGPAAMIAAGGRHPLTRELAEASRTLSLGDRGTHGR